MEGKLTDKIGGYMSRKIEIKKKPSDFEDNFYKYTPKDQTIRYKFPQFTFKGSSTVVP